MKTVKFGLVGCGLMAREFASAAARARLFSIRFFISAAAAFVNVTHSTEFMLSPPRIRRTMRAVKTAVLPLPAPASSSRGPSVVRTPRRCSGFSFAKSRAMHARRAAQKREEKSLMRSTCFLKILLDSTASPLPGQPFFPEFCREIKNLFYFLLTSTFVRFIMRLEQEF